jgi:hypothetical protein
VLLSLNIAFPLLCPFFQIPYNLTVMNHAAPAVNPGVFIELMLDVCMLGVGFMQIVSGVILVKSVFKIREFFREEGQESTLSTQ